MKTPSTPFNEESRLQKLKEYNILDSIPEPVFDDMVKIASAICNTPIALISLIDKDRQWFKSKLGLDVNETNRDVSFCGHAILQNYPLIINNALEDDRFSDNPLVQGGPKIRFYAGAPLITSDGHKIGTLCLIDTKPKHVTQDQIESLQALARQVVIQLELRKLNIKISYENNKSEIIIKQQEEKLFSSAKLAELGELSASISHEIKNPLNVISNYCDLLIMFVENNELNPTKILEVTQKIQKTVTKVNKIITNMKSFVRNGESDPIELTSLQLILSEAIELYKPKLISQDISLLEPELETDIVINCRESQILQVLINLLNNAADAVVALPERWIRLSVKEDSDWTYLMVTDSGTGITAEVKDKLFNKFFTTKEIGKGTGIGLNLSKRIIEDHHGTIYVDDASKNTCFVIRLPKNNNKKQT